MLLKKQIQVDQDDKGMECELMGFPNHLSTEQGPSPYGLSDEEEDTC